MPVLNCSVKTCKHNDDNKCRLEEIKVEGTRAKYSDETACESFRHLSGCNCTNESDRYASETCQVVCKAVTCIFNENEKCGARHIGISGSHASTSDETECSSFVMKEDR